MRMRDGLERQWRFPVTNTLGQKTGLDDIFGPIHNKPDELFEKLYVSRSASAFDDTEMLSSITNVKMGQWQDVVSKSKAQSFAEDIKKIRSGHFLTQLVAPVGNGKTTYLRHLLGVRLPKEIKDRRVVPIIYDVLDNIDITNVNLAESIYTYMHDQLCEISGCFGDLDKPGENHSINHKIELELFSRVVMDTCGTPYLHKMSDQITLCQRRAITKYRETNPLDFLNKKIQYVLSKKPEFLFVFVLDNIDQYAQLNQSIAVSVLNHISSKLDISTIITLRDTTYRLCVTEDPTCAWQAPNTYVLKPVNPNEIGYRRLLHLKKEAELDPKTSKRVVQFIGSISRQWKDRMPPRSGTNRGSFDLTELWEWIQNMGNHNYREMLDLIKHTLKSNHLTSKEFQKDKANVQFFFGPLESVNIKRFKTALVNGVHPYHVETGVHSRVVNLFDHESADNHYHYILRLKVLQYLNKQSLFTIKSAKRELLAALNNEYEAQVESIIRTFLKKHVISVELQHRQTRARTELDWDQVDFNNDAIITASSFVTPCGQFHLDTLIFDDIYLDEMKYVTDHTKNDLKRINRNNGDNHPAGRKRATDVFINLIMEEEVKYKSFSDNIGVSLLGERILESYRETKMAEGEFHPGEGDAKTA